MHRPINVYWNLNIKKFVPPKGAPEPGGPCHGIIGILVNPALDPPADDFWTYRATDWVLLPDGLSLWQAPSVWNSLPEYLRDPAVGKDSFRKQFKTFLFATYYCIQRIRGSTIMRYINSHYITLHYITYLGHTWPSSLQIALMSVLCKYSH